MNERTIKTRFWLGLILKLIVVYNLACCVAALYIFILKHFFGLTRESPKYATPIGFGLTAIFFGSLIIFYILVNKVQRFIVNKKMLKK
jgi:hypothetical protein